MNSKIIEINPEEEFVDLGELPPRTTFLDLTTGRRNKEWGDIHIRHAIIRDLPAFFHVSLEMDVLSHESDKISELAFRLHKTGVAFNGTPYEGKENLRAYSKIHVPVESMIVHDLDEGDEVARVIFEIDREVFKEHVELR